jgi:hypothetical protein
LTIHRNPYDGRVHLSELKAMATSPKHYVQACKEARTITRPMRVGSVADCIVFGNRGFAVYAGSGKNVVRNGAAWEAWEEEHAGQVTCIPSELADAQGAADAVLADGLAARLLDGCEFQRCLQWESHGLERASGILGVRGGLDAINERGNAMTGGKPYICDLKITQFVEPVEFGKHAWRMGWHVQGADFLEAARVIGFRAELYYLIGVEPSPPHDVVVMQITAPDLLAGERSIAIWSEKLRACESSGFYPGHAQSVVEMQRPAYAEDE